MYLKDEDLIELKLPIGIRNSIKKYRDDLLELQKNVE
jgi:hypothetical protein